MGGGYDRQHFRRWLISQIRLEVALTVVALSATLFLGLAILPAASPFFDVWWWKIGVTVGPTLVILNWVIRGWKHPNQIS